MIKFYDNRWKFYIISLSIFVLGIIMLFVNGVKLDIQFKGGAIISYSYENELEPSEVRNIVMETLGRDVEVRETTSNANIEVGEVLVKKIVLNFAGNEGLTDDDQLLLDTTLKEHFPDSNLTSAGSMIVKPFIGERFFRSSINALVIAAILIMLYVWYRFRRVSGLSAGAMSIVALAHDSLIVFFIFIIFNMPLNDSFIAVLLTIIGYSINDTIVIFDRIRENKKLIGSKITVDELVDKSITQSLGRSINTSITTFIVILIVYVFAVIYDIESIKSFALPMAFGIISGCYSSLCIAGPLWVSWQKYKKNDKTKIS